MRAAAAFLATTATAAALLIGTPAQAAPDAGGPLAGKVILLDPGHQLGNSNPAFAKQMAQKKFNGTTVKGCNTTGTATNGGYPEATFNWRVAKRLKRLLEAQGARVELTRTSNSRDAWGPCVWDRAKQANRIGADIMVNIHADGSSARNRGFFLLAPGLVKGWTEDVVKPGRRLAKAMISGMTKAGAPPSNYIRDQLMISTNTTGLNFSDVPTVTVELGNMRNAADARLMTSTSGQRSYARWLLAGIDSYFARG
ncbi:MAG: N-acetylmuramoyl-L-alanine amidase [Candidatus Nanopelagicales bacterium]|nr:N-acetylmuramoyl-L-alanine amidase [Candidatus Nanopelagicales bacterium]MCF8537782.1 N-acetylmuramoyl-L-alanine amidase [Candidatus Nanopelagicales bacterium]MCF8541715.1 N-acetylmuramoyl-L-alanine amidase [Candidatus Nanopelagicales bacterium]MCF8557733.1 N-acetylmuramoyl-L-alanine amidase [Candidatus Nanopelagicales bacterium]